MTFILHTAAETKFNKDAYDLVSLVEQKQVPKPTEIRIPTGSTGAKPSIDWSDKVDRARPSVYSTVRNDVKIDIYEQSNEVHTGFNETNYPTFKKFVDGIYKIKAVSSRIKYDFVHRTAFSWIMETYKAQQSKSDFVAFLKEEVVKVTGDYKYSFTILNLEIEKNFKLGEIEFEFLDASYFDKLESKNMPKDSIDGLREKFQGNVYASCILKGVQKDIGQEIALEECYKAMNVLKLFSPTVIKPEYKTTFDIDSRINLNKEVEYMVQNLEKETDHEISFARGSLPWELNSQTIEAIVSTSKNFVSLITNKEPNELQKLASNALMKYAEAISNDDIHRRIVDLFTIWESLLLQNDSVNIQDSLIMYGGAILATPINEKETFSSYIMSMYDVRSQVVHHANNKELDMSKVIFLQRDTMNIMEAFIGLSQKFSAKHEVLADIERFLGTTIEQYTENRKNTK